ncbi:uncharacterized protein LOC112089189 [Eutrema salsugineum]|uniref:uncharacterized protein LOC112089189 n=1 Tax=Eutrema salsugineum TaxID=72664 RepID=UPI000CED12AB|nr:uncharacterized protein LOC112089189 [Eutrema salsugineum]
MIKDWINIHHPLFGALSETHIQEINKGRILNAIPVGWRFFGNFEHHQSARIVVVWDPRVSVIIYQASAQAVTCGIFIASENVSLTITFVYGFNLVEDRHALWEELVSLNATTLVSTHPWAVVGDFNQIMRTSQHSDHLNLEVDISGMEDMNLGIQDAELFEAQAKGLIFSWWNSQAENPISKKIDHALINQSWAEIFPEAYAEFLEPQQSDHAVCLFRIPSLCRQKRKPFKFFHHVTDHPEYHDIVEEAWQYETIQGSNQFRLMRAMKLLKNALRKLNKRHYSGISQRVKEQDAKVAGYQWLLLSNPDTEIARQEHEAKVVWQTLITAEEKFYRQKSRVRWLQLVGDILSSKQEIEDHSADYFQQVIGYTDLAVSPSSVAELQDLLPFRCSAQQKLDLVKEVSADEIKSIIFSMPLSKSPGPDGYSVEFLRASWNTVGEDVTSAIREFFRNGRLLKDLNNAAITLIPKMSEACQLRDYRPISCCNLIYKIISKVDIRNAFDTLAWDFVIKVLEAQEFPPFFISWIKECISSPRYSISINGELAGFFPGKKVLRQGDSLSPYLFIMVMEVLSRMLEKAVVQHQTRLHPLCSTPRITHLLFADDLLVFSDGSRHSISGIKDTMASFKDMCGLDMNKEKS